MEKRSIQFSPPDISELEVQEVADALRSGWITTGPKTKELERRLDEVQITANKNTVPNEKRSPFVTSGVRLGTPAVTTRGFGVEEMDKIAEYITLAVNDFEANADAIRQGVNEICDKFPLYK